MRIPKDSVVINKAAVIERSLKRMLEEYAANPSLNNYTHIDAMILNIERACQAAIDLAQHLVALQRLGMPENSAEAFLALEKQGIISHKTAKAMIGMTGFRNVAIHEYQKLDHAILRAIAENEYQSIIEYCSELGLVISL